MADLHFGYELSQRARKRCEVITLAGSHDRHVADTIEFVPRWEAPDFVFQHADCETDESPGRVKVIGHVHPAASLTDGAGLHIRFPAFIQPAHRWILPAFSPWAGGAAWPDDGESRIWLCTSRQVLRIDGNRAAV